MSQETFSADDTANTNIDDSAVDKFFETGGNELPVNETTEQETTANADAEKTQQEVTQEPAEQQQKPEKVVPYDALHQERQRRKELAAQVKAHEEKMRKMEETFQRFVQQSQQPQEKAPSYDENPLEALRHEQEQLKKYIADHNAYLTKQHQTFESQQRQQQFANQYQQSALEYLKDKPDFSDAYTYLVQTRGQEYIAAGYDLNQAKQLLHEDEMAIAAKAFQDGVNPAERMYNLAVTRGYKKVEPVKENTQQAERKIEQMQQGLKQSKSLSNVGGKQEFNLTLESLVDMDDEDFSKYWDKIVRR